MTRQPRAFGRDHGGDGIFAKERCERFCPWRETLFSRARRLDEIIQLNSDYARVAFDDFTAEVTKIGSIYANMANQTMRVAKEGVERSAGG